MLENILWWQWLLIVVVYYNLGTGVIWVYDEKVQGKNTGFIRFLFDPSGWWSAPRKSKWLDNSPEDLFMPKTFWIVLFFIGTVINWVYFILWFFFLLIFGYFIG